MISAEYEDFLSYQTEQQMISAEYKDSRLTKQSNI